MSLGGAEGRATLLLEAKDQISGALGGVKSSLMGLGEATKTTVSRFGALKDALGVAAGVMIRDLANSMSRTITESAQLGAKVETLNASFNTLVQTSGGTTLTMEKLREATKGTVADVDLLTAANAAMALGLPTDDLDELFGAAMKLGRAMGIDTKMAVDSLSKGIGRQSKLILDNLGIVFKAEDAYKWYAEKIGTTARQVETLEEAYDALYGAQEGLGIAAFAQELENLGMSVRETSGEFRDWDYITWAVNEALDAGELSAEQLNDIYKKLNLTVESSSEGLTENQKKLAWQEYAIQQVTERAEALGDVEDEAITRQEQWSAKLTNLKTKFGELMGPISGFIGVLQPLMPMFTIMGAQLIPKLISGLIGMITQYGLAGTATHFLASAQAVLNAIMMANPILLVVMAIAALVAILVVVYQKCEPFRNIINAIADLLKGFFKAAVDKVIEILTWLWKNVVEPLGGALKWLWENVFKPLANFLLSVFVANLKVVIEVLEWLWKNVVQPLGDALNWLWKNILEPIANFIKNVLVAAIQKFIDTIKPLIDIAKKIGGFFNDIANALKSLCFKHVAPMIEDFNVQLKDSIGLANQMQRELGGLGIGLRDIARMPAITYAPTAPTTPRTVAPAVTTPQLREVQINQYIGQIASDYDARRAGEEAYRELMRRLGNKW